MMKAIALTALLLMGCSQADQEKTQQKLENGAKQAEQGLKTGAAELGKAAEHGIDVTKVKSVLMASSKLDSSKLNVDKEGNTFVLRGSVPNEEQKKLAEELTRGVMGKDDNVRNDLKTP